MCRSKMYDINRAKVRRGGFNLLSQIKIFSSLNKIFSFLNSNF